ncbi:hypothetical protein ACFYYY_18825 [Streptomyces sp. NPDC001834]|uniref:hypothetical protein n=1 Tax=Streptomyces sp. NPDC001834 TaxID=3364616 RepID=UPI00367F1AD0
MVGAEIDHGPADARVLTRFSYSRRALRWAGTAGAPWPPSSQLAAGEESALHGGDGADAECVALAAPYGHALVERCPLGGLQFGRAQEVGDLARHVEGDRCTVAQLKASEGFSNAVGLVVLKTCQESQEIQSYMTDPALLGQISEIAADALHAQHRSGQDARPEGEGSGS